jgi:hypothetical protein
VTASDRTSAFGSDATKPTEGSPTVRFASVNEEIPPESSHALDAVTPPQALAGNDQEKLKELSQTLRGTHLQERRMSHFAFEPVSLPTSRVCLLFPSHWHLETWWKGENMMHDPVPNALNCTLGQARPGWESPRPPGTIILFASSMGSQIHPHALMRKPPRIPHLPAFFYILLFLFLFIMTCLTCY